MKKVPLKTTALGLALACGLFLAQPQTAEAKLLPNSNGQSEVVAGEQAGEAAEPLGNVEVKAELTGEERAITIDEAMELALTNSSTVLAAQNDLAVGEVSKEQAASRARKYRYGMNDNQLVASASSNGTSQYTLVIYAPEAAAKGVELLGYALQAQEAACRLQTIQGYFTVVCDEQAEVSAQYSLEKALNQLNSVQSRFEQGMATRLEVLSAETQVNSAQTMLAAAKAQTVQAKRNLSVTMGLEPDTNWSPTSQLTYEPLVIEDVEAKVQEMIAASPTVALARATEEMAYLDYQNTIKFLPASTYAGKSAQLEYETAQIEYENAQRVAYTNAKSMLENLSLAREQYEIYNESQALLEEVYRLAVLQYENGLNTQNDIQAAAADIVSNDASRLQALLQYNIAKTAIEQGIVSTSSGN